MKRILEALVLAGLTAAPICIIVGHYAGWFWMTQLGAVLLIPMSLCWLGAIIWHTLGLAGEITGKPRRHTRR